MSGCVQAHSGWVAPRSSQSGAGDQAQQQTEATRDSHQGMGREGTEAAGGQRRVWSGWASGWGLSVFLHWCACDLKTWEGVSQAPSWGGGDHNKI